MANTELSDIFVPEVFASYQTNDSTEKTAFVESGIVYASPELNARTSAGGFLTTIPYWNDLDATVEPNYSNTTYTDVASPQKITSGEMTSRISYLNEGFSSSDLNKELAGSDPMQRIAARLDSYWQRQFQRRVLAIAVGLYNDNVAGNGGDMVVDISSTTPGTIVAANRFTSDGFIDAQYTMGDRAGGLNVLAVHSIVAKKMAKDQLIEYVKDADGRILYQSYMGTRIVIDDGMPTFGTGVDRKYLCILFGPNAIGYGTGTPKTPSEVQRYPERGNGGAVEVLWSRKTWLIHPKGYDFKSVTITAPGLSPTWADLQLATNWERKLDRKDVPLSFFVVNA